MDLMSLLARLTLDKTEFDKGLKEAESDAEGLKIPTPVIPKTDNTELKKGFDEAEGDVNIFSEVVSGVWSGLKDSLVSVGITGVVMGFANALRQGISLVVDGGKQIADNSKNLQISTKAYQEYEYALGKSNLQMKDLSTVMGNINKAQSGELTKLQAKAFEALGISAEEAKSGMMSTEDMLNKVMDSLADYDKADKGMIIDTLFGKNQNWTGYFEQTSEEIDSLTEEANKMGLIISDESIENAVKFNEAAEKITNTIEGLKKSFGEGILPIITDAVNKLTMVMNFFIGNDNRSSTEMFEDAESRLKAREKEIETESTYAKALVDRLVGMGDTSSMDANQLAVWKGTAAALIDMIPTLSGVIDAENASINGNAETIAEAIKQYEELEKATALQAARAEEENILAQKQNKINEESIKVNDKLAEAESKKADAYAAIDEFLGKNEGYRRNLELNAGYTGTMTDEIYQKYAGNLREWMGGNQQLQAYRDALAAAQEAQANVDALVADIGEGTEAYNALVESEKATSEVVSEAAQNATSDVNDIAEAIRNVPEEKTITFHVEYDGGGAEHSFAIGSHYIPYDMPAFLHRGERILTATENRNGSGESVDYGALENAIVAAIENGMSNVHVDAYMDGKRITSETNRNNRNTALAGRFRT